MDAILGLGEITGAHVLSRQEILRVRGLTVEVDSLAGRAEGVLAAP